MASITTDNKNTNGGKERSFRASWSPALEPYGFTQISDLLLENYHKLDINALEVMFIIHLFKYKWTVDSPFPSLETIATQMGKSRDAVQKYARNLEKRGYIKRKYRKGQTSYYDLYPIIKLLEVIIPFKNLPRESMQKALIPYVRIQTKVYPLRKKDDSSIKSIGDTIKARSA